MCPLKDFHIQTIRFIWTSDLKPLPWTTSRVNLVLLPAVLFISVCLSIDVSHLTDKADIIQQELLEPCDWHMEVDEERRGSVHFVVSGLVLFEQDEVHVFSHQSEKWSHISMSSVNQCISGLSLRS